MKISRLLPAILLCVIPLWAHAQSASEWPSRPVRFLVPWPAGGLNDIIARSFNDKVAQSLGRQVITDFKAGAAGRIGVTEIAKAKPDGYTIGMGNLGPLTIFPSLYKQMPYSVKDDLIPITMFAASPLVLVVSGDSAIKTVKDLIDAAKARPDVLNYASVGPGSPAHLTFELLRKRTGIDLLHVPFKGTNESLPAMFTGDIQAMFDTLPLVLPHIQAGKLRALAVTTLQRVPQLPDVPTLKELSLGDDEVVTWYAVIAPAGTPQPIVDRLYRAYTDAAGTPEVKKMLTDNGLIYLPNTMAQFQTRIAEETARWAQIIKENKLELDQ
jgi:tripartite-type tricarboxylate transporter receptor subunit TctC